MDRDAWHYELPEYSVILTFLDSVFAELNVGLLIYHAETADDPSSYRLIYANGEASRLTGTDLQQLVGRRFFEAFPGLEGTRVAELFREVATSGEARRVGVVSYADANVARGEYDSRAFPMPQHCFGVLFENLAKGPDPAR